jgi:FlaG/FlaF family flagellin (archaellin)
MAIHLPRMSFDLQGLTYDPSRKQNSMQKNFGYNNTQGKVYSQYQPVPYNFDFSLSIYVRNQEDGTQILEQILPFFTPDFTVTVDLIPDMDQKYDIPVILNSVSPEIDYEGDMMTTRTIIWTLNFTVKGLIFPPVNVSGKIIKQANTNIYMDTQKKDVQKVFVDYANGTGVFTTNEIVRVKNKEITGKVTYFSNTTNGILIVEDLSELLEPNDVLQGDYSHAIYTIDTVDINPVKAVAIVVTPDPIDADANDDYGYTESITEYPLTLLDFSNIAEIITEEGDLLFTEDSEQLTTEI